MLGSFHTKINHKLNALELYCRAEKLKGYQLQITGDIDEPLGININKPLITEWISLANDVGSVKPCLYITAKDLFEESKRAILQVTFKVDIGIHGLKHIHYSKFSISDLKEDFKKELEYSNNHRFPGLNWDLLTLHYASLYFSYDSSIVSSWMFPFKINDMVEYPVCPPTDTALRNKPVTSQTVKMYRNLINNAFKHDRSLTLLLHPNLWSLVLLRKLKTL